MEFGEITLTLLFEVIVQTLFAFFGILIFARLLNKQQVAQLTFYDYINGITFGSIAASLATDIQQRTWQHLLALGIFAFLTFLMSYISVNSRPARKILEGEPTVLIHNGKILEQNMSRLRYNHDNLMTQLREKDCFNVSDVEFAVIEPNGSLSVLLKSQKLPITPEDLGLPTNYKGISSELIVDGKIIYQNLQQNNLDNLWLNEELKKQGIFSVNEVSFASLDVAGNLYVDRKMDMLQNKVDMTDKNNKQ